jgi:hypothetical protein
MYCLNVWLPIILKSSAFTQISLAPSPHAHTCLRNLLEEPRASLVVQMPGWTGLANARVTVFGEIRQLPPSLQVRARCGCGAA